MKSIRLYTYFRSSCAYRVRIALHLKGLSFESIPIHLLKNGGEQNSTAFKKINPLAQVPSLEIDNLTISQSIAILEFLEEKYPSPPLLPQAPEARAVVRQMCEIINSGLQPLQGLAVTQYLENNLGISAQEKQNWLNHWIGKGLDSFEKLISIHSGQYCFGDQITFADCCLIPQVFSAERFKVDLKPYAKCIEISQRCLRLEAFQKASPTQQIDFE